MSKLRENLGKRIKQIRESKGIKQFVLADKLDMEPSNLTRIESGYQFPKEENLEKIANNLDVEIKDLFDFPKNLTKQDIIKKINEMIIEFDYEKVKFLYEFIKLYHFTK